MKISIIIPAYNCEDKIIPLLSSIEKQNLSDYEVIVINDGSKDNTEEIISDYIRNKDNVHLFTKKNEGAPKARNYGLKHAVGKYIYFCDADDLLCEEGGLELLLETAEAHGLDIAIGNYYLRNEKKQDRLHLAVENRMNILGKDKFFFCDPLPGNKIYRRDFLIENNLNFDNVKIGQDLNFYIKCLAVTQKIQYVNSNVYIYQVTTNSISRTYKKNNLLDIAESIHFIELYYKKNNMDNFRSKKNIFYLKIGNYTWQLRKKKHISKEDYRIIKEKLILDIGKKTYFDVKYLYCFGSAVVQYWLIKYFNLVLRGV